MKKPNTLIAFLLSIAVLMQAKQMVAAEVASGDSADKNASLSIQAILDSINNIGPYELPKLPLKTNLNYANSSSDVEPYGGVKPFKEHFLIQMEYTGPGRAIPEPENLDSVKIGFLGPIMPTVSVATGGKSHNEEALGIAMLRACRLAIEEANAKGGYIKRKIPFELCVRNDNALWGATAARPQQTTKSVSAHGPTKATVRPATKTAGPAKKPAFRLSSLFD